MNFIASTTNQNPIQKANMMFLSKKATNKDQGLKIQILLSLDKRDFSNSKRIWKKNVFFVDQKSDFTIRKPNFPDDTLVYCNQCTISTLKAGDYAIYLVYIILGQFIPASNCPDLNNYVFNNKRPR